MGSASALNNWASATAPNIVLLRGRKSYVEFGGSLRPPRPERAVAPPGPLSSGVPPRAALAVSVLDEEDDAFRQDPEALARHAG